MNLSDGRLAPAPGADGLVCRTDGAVLFVASTQPADDVAALLDVVQAASGSAPGRQLARQLAALVAADDDGSLPAFALVAGSANGTYVKAYGEVEISLHGPGGTERVSGVGSFTGSDRELPGPFTLITAQPAGAATPTGSAHVDVRAGTVPGGGFALSTDGAAAMAAPEPAADAATEAETLASEPRTDETPAVSAEEPPPVAAAVVAEPEPMPEPEPQPEPVMAEPEPVMAEPDPVMAEPDPEPLPVAEPAMEVPPVVEPPAADAPPPYEPPAADAPPPYEAATLPPTDLAAATAGAGAAQFTSQLLGALDDDDVEEREALPVELDPAEVRAPEQSTNEVMVQGVVCSRGHFNDPRSRFCSSCGISMVQNTQILTHGPRPPLGVMVFEDGATFSLASDYVVGRQPESSPLVASGEALPLQVDDPERSISRAHAELRLVDWDVHLVNLSETNGSFVWDPTSNQWIPIPAGQSVMLTPGMRVALGRRSAVFESSLVR